MGLVVLLAGLWGLSGGLLAYAALQQTAGRRAQARMERFGLQTAGAPTPWRAPELRATVYNVGQRLERHWPLAADRMAQLIGPAGFAGRIAPSELLGWKAVGLTAGMVLACVLPVVAGPIGLLAAPVPALGWCGPDLWLARRRAARRREIQRSLSTVMDLLALSLEAGMGLERALRVICDRVDSPLTEELRRVLADVSLGIGRREAFERMVQRVALDDVRAISAAILQAEELSASLVSAMRVQARQVRLNRRRQVEAEALRAPVKMMFPTVLFTLPALLILLLGPVVLRIVFVVTGGR